MICSRQCKYDETDFTLDFYRKKSYLKLLPSKLLDQIIKSKVLFIYYKLSPFLIYLSWPPGQLSFPSFHPSFDHQPVICLSGSVSELFSAFPHSSFWQWLKIQLICHSNAMFLTLITWQSNNKSWVVVCKVLVTNLPDWASLCSPGLYQSWVRIE